mmetsp:Transcript_105469/g.308361  ORF Transcript_105469/g.308361 Transcript_105469/m.308361 type:complete len:299 (+) Transcript_105469:101-997(+)
MGASIGADAREAHAAWSSAERETYVRSTGLVCPQGEEAVQRFLADAIVVAPLPAPWVLHRSLSGEHFFVNGRTGVASWSHPLEPCLRELADLCRKCLELSSELREAMIVGLHSKWEADAKGEYLKWFSADDADGRTYYCHCESRETMWEHPAEALLPEHYLRLASAELLGSDRYIRRIQSPRPSEENVHLFSSSSRRCLRRRRVQEPAGPADAAEAYFIGDPEGDSDAEQLSPLSHLTIDIPSDDDMSTCGKDADRMSSWSTRSTEAYFIGDSDDDTSDLDEDNWSNLDLEADLCKAP